MMPAEIGSSFRTRMSLPTLFAVFIHTFPLIHTFSALFHALLHALHTFHAVFAAEIIGSLPTLVKGEQSYHAKREHTIEPPLVAIDE